MKYQLFHFKSFLIGEESFTSPYYSNYSFYGGSFVSTIIPFYLKIFIFYFYNRGEVLKILIGES